MITRGSSRTPKLTAEDAETAENSFNFFSAYSEISAVNEAFDKHRAVA
jgi:hypothetical protein